ncbi:MAG: MBL fold metallo-hydrolase [Deltaproteobacteria bacterium]|nr:MBL fold metallo-hydrolase [Deltaproteobacteria bacterium]
MKLTVLGCGTSTGVPIIGCKCVVCASPHPRNKRTRSSLLVEINGLSILIDTSTDLRTQALRHGLERLDGVLFTHHHADHVHGIDDLRAFNMAQGTVIPCYGNKAAISRIRSMFKYIFTQDPNDGWKPRLSMRVVKGRFKLSGIEVQPINILHGKETILGYRIGSVAYLTDCSSIPEESMAALKKLDLLILGALRHKPHPTHFSIGEAIEAARKIAARRTVFTHLGHNVDYETDNAGLPQGVELAYDGMVVEAG